MSYRDHPSREAASTSRGRVLLSLVLTVAGIGLLWLTTRLAFTAGSPFIDLFVPVGALACGVVSSTLGVRQRRSAIGGTRGGLLVVVIIGGLVAAAAALLLLLIFGLCGAYWMRTSC